MKKLFFLFAFMGVFAFASNAQTKACCASKTAGAKVCSKTMDKAASADANIVKQVSNTGDVSYVRKAVCPMSGKVTMSQVEYCTKSGKFINVSPSDVGAKAACTKKATATKVASTSKKACCAKGDKAACAKKASTKKASTSAVKAKLVSETESN